MNIPYCILYLAFPRAQSASREPSNLLKYNKYFASITGDSHLSLNGNGDVVFNPGTDYDHLAQGASTSVNFSYIAKDELGALSDLLQRPFLSQASTMLPWLIQMWEPIYKILQHSLML
jgi:hypothetical protein